MLQHYITLKFKEGTPEAHRDEFCRRMLALQESIDEVKEIQIGRDIVNEARSWHLLMKLVVEDIDSLKRYQAHPEHQALVAFNGPHVDAIGVVDFNNFE